MRCPFPHTSLTATDDVNVSSVQLCVRFLTVFGECKQCAASRPHNALMSMGLNPCPAQSSHVNGTQSLCVSDGRALLVVLTHLHLQRGSQKYSVYDFVLTLAPDLPRRTFTLPRTFTCTQRRYNMMDEFLFRFVTDPDVVCRRVEILELNQAEFKIRVRGCVYRYSLSLSHTRTHTHTHTYTFSLCA